MQILVAALAVASLFAVGPVNEQHAMPPVGHKPISLAWDVPAVGYASPASHPCNVTHYVPGSNGTLSYADCITRDETRYKCADSARILLTSEDGVHHCILFPQQEEETVTVGGK